MGHIWGENVTKDITATAQMWNNKDLREPGQQDCEPGN